MTIKHASRPGQPTALRRRLRITVQLGTNGTQTQAFIAGISGTSIPGPTKSVVINDQGQLGTAKAKGGEALAATVDLLTAQLKRQQRQIDRLRELVKAG